MKNVKFKNLGFGDKTFTVVNYVLLSIVFILVLYPLVYVVSASFSDPQAVVSGEVLLLPVRPTLAGYKAVFQNSKIMQGFLNSFFYLIVGTSLNIVMTMLCAYPLTRKEFRARNFFSIFFVVTMYFSGGMVPSYILVNKLGLIDTRWALIIPTAMSTYNMIICRTYIINLTIVMRDILIMNEIDMTMVTDASSVAKLQGLSELLKYSTIVVASLPVMLLYPLIQKHLIKGMMIGAVKG